MEINISELPIAHRFAAASMLMAKGNRLTDLASSAAGLPAGKRQRQILQGLSFYDMALSLMKPHDPNFQTLLNWKCLALISLGQYEDARRWYEELVRIAAASEGANSPGPTARLALEQIASLAGKPNESLPETDPADARVFDDPPFCEWVERFCHLLQAHKFEQAHRYLGSELRETVTSADLKRMWSEMLGPPAGDTTITLERYELATESDGDGHVGWCYFSITNDEVSEAVSVGLCRGTINVYEICSLEMGRP